jgi:hypothetical protein
MMRLRHPACVMATQLDGFGIVANPAEKILAPAHAPEMR